MKYVRNNVWGARGLGMILGYQRNMTENGIRLLDNDSVVFPATVMFIRRQIGNSIIELQYEKLS